MTPRTSRDAQAEATRDRIMDAALKLFAKQGFAATSTRKIAAEADVSEGLIFHHYPNKRALLLELSRKNATLLSRVVELTTQDPEPDVDAFIAAILDQFLVQMLPSTHSFKMFKILVSESLTQPDLGELFQHITTQLHEHVRAYLERRRRPDNLRDDLELVASSWLSSLIWFVLTHHALDDALWLEAARTHARRLEAHWLLSLRAPSSYEVTP